MAHRHPSRIVAVPIVVLLTTIAAAVVPQLSTSQPPDADAIPARVDPYVPKQRVIVLTDIANEPDDQMSWCACSCMRTSSTSRG